MNKEIKKIIKEASKWSGNVIEAETPEDAIIKIKAIGFSRACEAELIASEFCQQIEALTNQLNKLPQ